VGDIRSKRVLKKSRIEAMEDGAGGDDEE